MGGGGLEEGEEVGEEVKEGREGSIWRNYNSRVDKVDEREEEGNSTRCIRYGIIVLFCMHNGALEHILKNIILHFG